MLNITNHREMQIKTTMRYHLTLVRMAIIKKSTTTTTKKTTNNVLVEYVEKRELLYTVGWRLVTAIMENCIVLSQKL